MVWEGDRGVYLEWTVGTIGKGGNPGHECCQICSLASLLSVDLWEWTAGIGCWGTRGGDVARK